MNFPEWTRPGAYGAAIGAVTLAILGFSWGGWMTSGSAKAMADELAADQVTMAMVPVCLDMSAADPERVAKLATVQAASRFDRRKALIATGWATIPGSEKPSNDLVLACIEGLELDGS